MIHVLLVDDHEMVRRGLRQILGAISDISCDEASSADAALAALASGIWHAVLLDIGLPGRAGLDLLGDIKQRWPKLPVLVVSAHKETDYAVRAFRAGASGYFVKDAAADELVLAVRRILAGRRYVSSDLAEALAGRLDSSGVAPLPHEVLSDRELQVLRLVASGRTLKEIASQLKLSDKTIATYRARIAAKLGVSTNVEITRYAFRNKLVE